MQDVNNRGNCCKGNCELSSLLFWKLKAVQKKKKIYKLKKNENKKCYMVVIQFAMIANVCEKVILIYLVNSWSNFKKIFLIIKENKNLKDLKFFQ